MKILFVCKYNRFRSRVAELYFKKINKNKSIKVSSAGLIEGKYPLDKEEIAVAKEFGIKISGRPKGLNSKLLREQDILVIVADNVPKEIFDCGDCPKKIIVWKIPDVTSDESNERIRYIITKIVKEVNKFVGDLENGNN